MSDILVHSAIIENQTQLRKWVAKKIDPLAVDDLSYYSSNSHAGEPVRGSPTKYFQACEVTQCPQVVKDWKKYLSPVVKTHTNGFKVCDTSGYYRCGSSCTWTVPAGVTSVQFQLWAPGGSNSGQCCCGGTPFGPSGSYMVSTVPVTPGQVYCLCSGCAYCCYASQTTPGGQGSPTWICSGTGYSVCAEAPYSCYCCWNAALFPSGSACGIQLPQIDGCAATQCSGWNFCWDTSDDKTAIAPAFGKETWYATTPVNSVNYGIPVVYPGVNLQQIDQCGSSWFVTAPVFGFENCTCCWSNSTLWQFGGIESGYGGCYYNAQNGYQQIPAVGGFAGWVCGGQGASGGDAGGMGMICVSYNCG